MHMLRHWEHCCAQLVASGLRLLVACRCTGNGAALVERDDDLTIHEHTFSTIENDETVENLPVPTYYYIEDNRLLQASLMSTGLLTMWSDDHLLVEGGRELFNAETAEEVRSVVAMYPGAVRSSLAQFAAMRAALEESTCVFVALLEVGVDPNGEHSRLPSGFTLLHVAAFRGNPITVKALISARADLDVRVKHVTPLHLAAAEGHEECVWLLMNAGADYTIGDNVGHTPVCYARDHGHSDLVSSMRQFMNARAQRMSGRPWWCSLHTP